MLISIRKNPYLITDLTLYGQVFIYQFNFETVK
jgi:hypothetical protein